MSSKNIILIKCQDRRGLISQITGEISKLGLNIVSNQEYVLKEENIFFMRTEIEEYFDFKAIRMALLNMMPNGAKVIIKSSNKKNIIIFATKEAHCIGDLLVRNYSKELNANILAVISNHITLKNLVQGFSIPFHFVDHNDCSRVDHEKKIHSILNTYNFDLLVLAKYMRIITADFINQFSNRVINIHHSFLPAFIGANPYRQAYNRGVKIIGATAHFVTSNLDEGPIIEQSITQINHSFTPKAMAQAGRDVEKVVLAKALKLALDNRIFVHKNKTIIFK